jgi:hypothetical protein
MSSLYGVKSLSIKEMMAAMIMKYVTNGGGQLRRSLFIRKL